MIDWRIGEITHEPPIKVDVDDWVTCANYTRDNNLLNMESWKKFRKTAN